MQTGEFLLSQWRKRSLCTRRRKASGKVRSFGRHARQVERVNADVRPSLWRAASHWLSLPIPRLSLSTPTLLYTTTDTSIPTTWASHPLSSTYPFLNDRRRKRHNPALIPLRAEDSRPLFRSFSRLARDAVSLLLLPRTEPTGSFPTFDGFTKTSSLDPES